MKRQLFFLIFFGLSLVLALAACSAGGGTEPAAPTAAPPDADTAVSDAPESNCPEAQPGVYQLIAAAEGICFLYPDRYDVFDGGGSFTLYVDSPLNTEAPLAAFSFEPANGRTLDEIAAQRLADFGFPDTQPQPASLGGEPAVMLDNLPGQDTNRRLVAVHEGQVIDLMVARIGAEYGEVGAQAEGLYTMITDSLQFIPPALDIPLRAGPECPAAPAGATLFTNTEDGFCLLLPEGYAVDDSLTTETGGAETAVYVDSRQDAAHARLFITVEDANGRALDEITATREAEIESAMPGFDVTWSFGYMLDGVPANQFHQAPGQDLSRQVVMVRNGRLYTLTFIPDDPDAGPAYDEMEILYEMVMDSFSFLWQWQ